MIKELEKKVRQYKAPDFVVDDLIYFTVGGSKAYGVAGTKSDIDLYGICVPDMDRVFPSMAGNIPGFGIPVQPWTHWGYQGGDMDMMVYSIVRFFDMAMQGNPNIIEILFTADHHVLLIEELGVSLKGSAEMFLSNNVIPKFIGFYQSSRNKMFKYTSPKDTEIGYNSKSAYHSMRLLLELDQLLQHGTMDLEAYADLLTGIRHGGYAPQAVETMIDERYEKVMASKSVLRDVPNEKYIKAVLVDMLETYWDKALDIPMML